MEKNWTKEPWSNDYSHHQHPTSNFYSLGPTDYARALKCVNAMEGIVDPEGFMRSVKEDMEAEAEFNRKADEAIKDTENAREYLIKEGFDPDEIGKQGATFVKLLMRKTVLEKDDKEIREIIGADENEATTDEVRSLMLNYKRAKEQMYKIRELVDGCATEFTELVNLVSPGG